MQEKNNLIVKHVDSCLVDYINDDNLIECIEGALIDNYLFMLDDNSIYQYLLDDENMFSKEHDYSTVDQLVNTFKYVYVLESYANEWSSDHTYIFTVDHLNNHDEIFYMEEEY